MNEQTIGRTKQITDRSILGFAALFGIYCGAVALGGPHGAKLVGIGPLVFDAGLVTYSLSFMMTDICSEVYGKFYSRKMVLGGFFALIAALITTQIAMSVPAAAEWELANEYVSVFGAGSRLVIAAMVTFIVSQFVDIQVFTWIRRKTGGKYLWLRNNLSTLAGGAMDAIIFSTIAFYGVYPVLPIILSAYTIRIFISLIDTPLVYLGVWILRKKYPELKK